MELDSATIRTALSQHAAWLVFGNVLLQQLGLPLPVVPTLLVAGSLAAGGAALAQLLLAALTAALVADRLWYLAGRRFGYGVLAWMCRLSINPGSCITATEARFTRWGLWSLLLAKFIPGFSAVAAPLAGVLRMPALRFTLAAGLGALLWAGSALAIGWQLRHQVDGALELMARHGARALLVAGLLLGLWLAWKLWRRQRFLRWAAMPSLSAQEWWQALDTPQAPRLIDLRSPALIAEQGPIPQAVPLSLSQLPRTVRPWPRHLPIVTLCACPHDAAAARAAHRLRRLGFAQARHLRGGFEAWQAAKPSPTASRPSSTSTL